MRNSTERDGTLYKYDNLDDNTALIQHRNKYAISLAIEINEGIT